MCSCVAAPQQAVAAETAQPRRFIGASHGAERGSRRVRWQCGVLALSVARVARHGVIGRHRMVAFRLHIAQAGWAPVCALTGTASCHWGTLVRAMAVLWDAGKPVDDAY